MKVVRIEFSKSAEKSLKKIPSHIKMKLLTWVRAVKISGIEEVQKIRGYHDEPLMGKRKGQRSIRLNRAYRAIYERSETDTFVLVEIVEVSKHEY